MPGDAGFFPSPVGDCPSMTSSNAALIARALAHAHGGDLVGLSHEGGAQFRLTLAASRKRVQPEISKGSM